jgi:choline kinase
MLNQQDNQSSATRSADARTPSAKTPSAKTPSEGLVLAAGAGRRLRPHTDCLPKTLVTLDDGTTALDRILANFSASGLTRASIVVGYCADAVEARIDDLQSRYKVEVELIVNDHPEDRNNAYSLWCARDALSRGVLMSNGDTLHPPAVQHRLLAEPFSHNICLAIDDVKVLGDEEMKVALGNHGALQHISKSLPHDSSGEYIGVALIPATAAPLLIDALERTWQQDASQFYEAAFQHLATTGAVIETRSIGTVDWIEIDTLEDLDRANVLLCRS